MQNDENTSPLYAPAEDVSDANHTDENPIVQRLSADDDWQFWDVDATPAGISAPDTSSAQPVPHIADIQDDVLVASLVTRRYGVEPGNSVVLPVTVLNNGGRRLTARAHLEGWLDDRWVVEPFVQTSIPPGERRTLELTVAPPRSAAAEAGDYQLAVVVRSSDEPARTVRLGLILTMLPFDRVQIELAEFPHVAAAWWRRTLPLALRIANEGNCAQTLRLNGAAPGQLGRVTFPGSAEKSGIDVALQPGQRARVPARLTVTRLPPIALHARSLPFTISAAGQDGKMLHQLRSEVEVRPVVGAWLLALLVGLTMTGTAVVFLLAIVGVLFLRIDSTAQQPAVAAAPPAPAVIVVTLNEPVNTSAPEAAGSAPSLAQAVQSQPDPSLPLVLPDQVTAPGNGGPLRIVEDAPVDTRAGDAPRVTTPDEAETAETSSSSAAPMTYAQMFQAVAAQYDHDWRMLAAQAYVESSFDALALSSAGAMGLMQVLPTTWREWAPVVGASDPFDSYSNVQVAALYLDHLRTQLAARGHPEKEWMLVAYNWGPDRVSEFLAGGGTWQDLPAARRQYAEDILRIAQTLP